MFGALGSEVLKFRSPKSFQYFINCKDNHKAWQGFEIFLHGTIMELIHLYCAETTTKPTPFGFMEWQHNVKNPTLRLVCHLTLTIGLAIYVQRIGDRNNDVRCSNAGRMKFTTQYTVKSNLQNYKTA